MKSRICAAVIFVLSGAAGLAAPPIRTDVIAPGSATLTLTVQDKRILRVFNFVHEGTAAGTLSLTKNSQTGTVMTSTAAESQEVRKAFVIAGPATVAIAPVATSTLMISYQFDANPPD
jgi:hypothetical protein